METHVLFLKGDEIRKFSDTRGVYPHVNPTRFMSDSSFPEVTRGFTL